MTEPAHRDPEKLRESWERHESVRAVARELGCNHTTASKWLNRYGIRKKREMSFAQKIQNGAIDASEIELSNGEGSA